MKARTIWDAVREGHPAVITVGVALRAPRHDQAPTSLVAVYPRGQDFWQGGRGPALANPLQSLTGTADEMLDMAKKWTQEPQS